MPEAYAAADVFTLPSRDEGTPLTVLEAMAAGLPCVVSDDRALDELALCPGVVRVPGTGTAVAAAIGAHLSDPVRRQVSGAETRAWAEAHYGEERIARRHLDLVAQVSAE